MLVDGQVAKFVDDEECGLQVALELALEPAGGLGGGQGIDDIDGGGEEHRVSMLAGSVAEGDRDVRFAEANIADQDDVGLGGDESQTEQVLDLRPVDFCWPVPLEVIEGLEHGERALLIRRSMLRLSRIAASPSISSAR